jgi:hypothetical protein
MDDRAFASATQLANEIRDRRIGCVELLDFYLARAERHNPALNAIVVMVGCFELFGNEGIRGIADLEGDMGGQDGQRHVRGRSPARTRTYTRQSESSLEIVHRMGPPLNYDATQLRSGPKSKWVKPRPGYIPVPP